MPLETIMRKHQHRNRFIALLLGAAALLLTGWANADDPPARVMRLGYITGAVSFSPAGEEDWVQATVNRPLVSGDRLWADAGARAELQAGPVMLRMGSATSVTLLNLDDRVVQLQLAQGTFNVRVHRFDANQVLEIDTPNLAFSIRSAGDYRVDVDPAGNATTVVTRNGQAEVYGESAAYVVDAGRSYRFSGTGLADYEFLDLPPPDELDLWASDRDQRWETSVSARYVSPDVIGYQDLDNNGRWRVEAGYGNVWVPNRVAIGWAPYRDGHWAWIDPWGWTWVDDAPWGFAVSHYGRWANVRDTWCWVPGPVRARAVYAPALVAFVGGRNFQVGISAGNVGAIGWFPLGPRDVYRPAYPVSRTYFNRVNTSNTVINVTNITNVYNNRNVTNVTYANQRVPGAVVAMPTTAFAQAQPVSRAAMRVGRQTLANAQVSAVAAVAPMPVSVRGSASPGQKPPAPALDRRVIAKTAPPAAPVAFAAKQRLLAQDPGKPLDRSAVGTLKSAAPVPAPKVQVVAPVRAAGPVVAPPTPRGPSEQRGKGAPRGEPALSGTAPQAVPPAQAVPPPLQRGQTPPTSVQPSRSPVAPAPAGSQRQGMPDSRAQPPMAVPQAPAVAPAPVPAVPEQRGRAESRGQPPVVATPPAAVVPMPAPMPLPVPPIERRAGPEQRSAPPVTAAPAPVPASAAVPAPAVVPAPIQRAQPEPRGRPEPAQAARPVPPPAPPMTRGPAAPPQVTPPVEPRPAAGAAPPPAARQDRRTDEQKKADEEERKRK